MSYETIWHEMAAVAPTRGGYLRRRLRPDLPFDLFLGLEQPSAYRMLALEVADSSMTLVVEPRLTRGVELRINRWTATKRTSLEVRLLDPSYQDIFTCLVGDLVASVAGVEAERDAIAMFAGRFERWERFLKACGPQGLSEESQRGLYGELWFIAHNLLNGIDRTAVAASWTGPEAAAHDFQFPGCAVEVKTTATKLPQHLSIASERQLDDIGLDRLFLVHLALEAHRGSQNTLPELIDKIRVALEPNEAARNLFEERLLSVGYLEIHRSRYQHPGYIIRHVGAFRVQEGFPRITEATLAPGLGNVRYSVAVAACSPFAVAMTDIQNTIRGADGQ